MTGTIVFDNGGTQQAPETLTPPSPPVTGNDPFAGTWEAPYGNPPPEAHRIIAVNGSYSQYAISSGTPREFIRGTYTVSGNTVNGSFVSVDTNTMGGPPETNWTAWDSLSNEWKTNLGGSKTFSLTISSNSFTNLGMTFTKK